MDRISIVVPCFNEEEALPVYYREMKRVMGELSEVSFEILFVDDGSSDKTLEILKQLNEKMEDVNIYLSPETLEKKQLYTRDLNMQVGDYVVNDGRRSQDPPGLLRKCIVFRRKNITTVSCDKTPPQNRRPKIRSFLSETFYKFIIATRQSISSCKVIG